MQKCDARHMHLRMHGLQPMRVGGSRVVTVLMMRGTFNLRHSCIAPAHPASPTTLYDHSPELVAECRRLMFDAM